MSTAHRLSGFTKAAYGLGLAAEGLKSNAFNMYLLFFYQQIVGLDPALTGLALFISLGVDAVADPAIGVWSDGLSSRLGRRHPFMYAATIPLALSYLAVFMPPGGMSQSMKFIWLLTFAISTRVTMALFVIPHQSLVPELTSNVDDRTTLMSLRTVFAWLFGLVNALLSFLVFFKATPEYAQGLLNPEGYDRFAIFGALAMTFAMVVSALGTQRAASQARERLGNRVHEMSLKELPGAIRQAWQSQSYRVAVMGGLALSVGYGVTENLNNYLNTFFWGFTSDQLGQIVVVIFLSSMVVLMSARGLIRRFGNRRIAILSVAMTGALPAAGALRLVGVIPRTSDPGVFYLFMGVAFIFYLGIILGGTVSGTMIADVTDEHELATGARQEGLLFSAGMFIQKAASGLGVLASGLIVKLSHFPENSTPGNVDLSTVNQLAMFAGLGCVAFSGLAIYFFSQYRLTRAKHAAIVQELRSRRAQGNEFEEREPLTQLEAASIGA